MISAFFSFILSENLCGLIKNKLKKEKLPGSFEECSKSSFSSGTLLNFLFFAPKNANLITNQNGSFFSIYFETVLFIQRIQFGTLLYNERKLASISGLRDFLISLTR